MAALTSSTGLWPGTAYQTFTAPVTYRPLTPRARIPAPASPAAVAAAAGGSGSTGPATSFPAAPAFTRFPTIP